MSLSIDSPLHFSLACVPYLCYDLDMHKDTRKAWNKARHVANAVPTSAVLSFSWHKMDVTGVFEVTAYVS